MPPKSHEKKCMNSERGSWANFSPTTGATPSVSTPNTTDERPKVAADILVRLVNRDRDEEETVLFVENKRATADGSISTRMGAKDQLVGYMTAYVDGIQAAGRIPAVSYRCITNMGHDTRFYSWTPGKHKFERNYWVGYLHRVSHVERYVAGIGDILRGIEREVYNGN